MSCWNTDFIIKKHNINTRFSDLHTDDKRYCIFYTFMLTTTHSY